MKCTRCIEATKDGEPYGSPIRCAFDETGTFRGDNWNCQTIGSLRDWFHTVDGEDSYQRDDMRNASFGYIPIPEHDLESGLQAGYIVMSWYKDRGRTGQAWVFWDEDEPEPLTLKTAEYVAQALGLHE